MSNEIPMRAPSSDTNGQTPLNIGGPEITPANFRDCFTEDLHEILDLDRWRIGSDLAQEYRRVEREVQEAVAHEDVTQTRIRERIFPLLEKRKPSLRFVGKHTADRELLARVHQGLLFTGGVEACDGRIEMHETLPLTIYQIGVSLVSYRGDQGTWCQRLFRRDLRQQFDNPVEDAEEALKLLEIRSRRDTKDALGELVQKTFMEYAERAILLRRSQARWLMGHGNPVTYELLSGGGLMELMVASTNVLREMVEKHQRFVFVASQPKERLLLTIGHALHPLEFVIVGTLDEWVRDWLHQLRFKGGTAVWDGEEISSAAWIPRFIEQVCSRIVVGVYRASLPAPPQLFYAHADHADLAAHIVLADSMLQEQRGAPLLIDLAGKTCRTVFGDSLQEMTDSAYAAAGVAWRYR